MFRENDPSYMLNEAGKPDFGSVLLTIDSNLIRLTADSPDVVQKVVLSTQSPAASLVGLFRYYGEPDAIAQPQTMNMLMEAGRLDDPIFVYITPREGSVEVLMGSGTWDNLVEHPAIGDGSLLQMTERVQDIVARSVSDFQAQAGGIPRLFCMSVLQTPPLEDPDFVADPPQVGDPAEDLSTGDGSGRDEFNARRDGSYGEPNG